MMLTPDEALRHGVMFLLREHAMVDCKNQKWDAESREQLTCRERRVPDGGQCSACEASYLMSQMVGEGDDGQG